MGELAANKCYYDTGHIDPRQPNDTVENLNIIKMLLLSQNKNYLDLMMKNMSYHYSDLQQNKSSVKASNSSESLNTLPSSSSKQVFFIVNRNLITKNCFLLQIILKEMKISS